MLVGCITTFNDLNTITDALYSLAKVADKIIVLDGSWKGFPYPGRSGSSDDGTLEIVENIVKKPEVDFKSKQWDIITRMWKSEKHKFNESFKRCEVGDWLLFLQGHECILYSYGIGMIGKFETLFGMDAGYVMFVNSNLLITHGTRIFKAKENMKFDDKLTINPKCNPAYLPVVIWNMNELRNPMRLQLELEYRKTQNFI